MLLFPAGPITREEGANGISCAGSARGYGVGNSLVRTNPPPDRTPP